MKVKTPKSWVEQSHTQAFLKDFLNFFPCVLCVWSSSYIESWLHLKYPFFGPQKPTNLPPNVFDHPRNIEPPTNFEKNSTLWPILQAETCHIFSYARFQDRQELR